MRLSRSFATFITLLLSTSALIPPASAAVANDEYGTATVLVSMPVVLTADATNATTSVTNGRPGCYRDMWYRLPSITSTTVVSRVSGGTAYIVPSADAARWWDTSTARVAIPADGSVSRWSAGSYLVLCRDTDSSGVVSVSLDGQLIAPSPVTASPGNQSFAVSWGPGANGESQLSGYRVDFRAVGAGAWSSSPTLATSVRLYTVSGLTNNVQYEYRVWALSTLGSSAALPVQSIWVGKPSNLASVSAVASYGAVIVNWAASSETAVVKGVLITVSCVGVTAQTYQSAGPAAGSHAFVGLVPGTVCTATGSWLGLYGFDGPSGQATPGVTVLDFPAPTTADILRAGGASYVRWTVPTLALPAGTTVYSHRISVQCVNPTWTVAKAEVVAGTTQWLGSGMALGASCVASVLTLYRDALGNIGQSKPTVTALTRIMEVPVQPSVGPWKPSGAAMVFPLTVPTSTGREPESVTVREYRAGVLIATTVLTPATGWAYQLPLAEVAMNTTETFTAVASNAVGNSTVLAWSQRIPTLPETLTASLFSLAPRAQVNGPQHLALTIVNNASRPWMRDPAAVYLVTTRNRVSGAERVLRVPMGTTSIPDLGHFIPSNMVQVSLETEMGASAPLVLTGGPTGPKPLARASISRTTKQGARVTWAKTTAGGQVRIEIYRGKSFVRMLAASRHSGGINIAGLKPSTSYRLAIYTYDGVAFSAKPLLVTLTTTAR